jgi:hypothetical protein
MFVFVIHNRNNNSAMDSFYSFVNGSFPSGGLKDLPVNVRLALIGYYGMLKWWGYDAEEEGSPPKPSLLGVLVLDHDEAAKRLARVTQGFTLREEYHLSLSSVKKQFEDMEDARQDIRHKKEWDKDKMFRKMIFLLFEMIGYLMYRIAPSYCTKEDFYAEWSQVLVQPTKILDFPETKRLLGEETIEWATLFVKFVNMFDTWNQMGLGFQDKRKLSSSRRRVHDET